MQLRSWRYLCGRLGALGSLLKPLHLGGLVREGPNNKLFIRRLWRACIMQIGAAP